ncbi:hypothetical protein BDW75DRAFT_117804 [Aspergillus navahoensis]
MMTHGQPSLHYTGFGNSSPAQKFPKKEGTGDRIASIPRNSARLLVISEQPDKLHLVPYNRSFRISALLTITQPQMTLSLSRKRRLLVCGTPGSACLRHLNRTGGWMPFDHGYDYHNSMTVAYRYPSTRMPGISANPCSQSRFETNTQTRDNLLRAAAHLKPTDCHIQ